MEAVCNPYVLFAVQPLPTLLLCMVSDIALEA
jgi:hypothetical protein